ncbi:alanine racemase [Microbacterium sp. BK668]|uniref:alanine racemase n=1 Tax=Microbacterium sp. BK668 TaxID=2512118 RepID=UPI00105C9D40|nr:alanine racemase [Microbacterium sp. BK668]TDN92884.1 alanine racemase [Microbacterium sp. BK668]
MTGRLWIDADAFAANLAEIARRIAPAEHMLVVKDDAYGHGLQGIVSLAWDNGIRWFGAFDARTGRAIRAELGDGPRIFVWIVASAEEAQEAISADLDIGVGDAALLEEVAAASGRARVHLKIDSGLRRNGVRPEEWPAFTARAAELERAGAIEVVGIWSHIAEASDAEDDEARAVFDLAAAQAELAGLRPRLKHLAASAAGFARPEFRYDLVRIGAFAYGIRPAGGPAESELGIRPIASLVAEVIRVDGDRVVVGTGSLDGLPSTLAGRLVVETPAGPRTVRSIAAEESDVDGWPTAAVGDEVIVLGAAASMSATDAAELIGTIGEEIAVRIAPTVERRRRDERPTR